MLKKLKKKISYSYENKMKRITVLSESSYDFKYKNIFSKIDGLDVIEGNFLSLLLNMIKSNTFYHIRYIKYRGKFLTILRILLVTFFALITRTKIIWTCHNIYEHTFPSSSYKYNDFVRYIISLISFRIIVFHKDISCHFPDSVKKKIIVSSFGNFDNFLKNKNGTKKDFIKKFIDWKKQKKIKEPDIISVSAAKINNIELLIEGAIRYKINTLVVCPRISIKTNDDNIFIYDDFVYREIDSILTNSSKLVGFVGHSNISVPTSIYMFASYGIPIIGLEKKPVSSIIRDNKIGIIINSSEDVMEALREIRENYNSYRMNCQNFILRNSWENAAKSHQIIFQE